MQRALALAALGRGAVEPNPLVGALVVRDGQLVGEGWHQGYGKAHAEVNALAAAGAAARGATLYVTLEPCCHHGKTPPCTEAVLHAGIRRVVAAMEDPFPQVSGQGAAHLRAAGLEVEIGLGEAEARWLNAPYLKLLTTGTPYVHAKWAMTLDGKIATRSGDSKWISGPASRERAHVLRGRMDAILVGIDTVLADDPLLTARPPGPRTPMRIVLDSRGRMPAASQLARTARESPVLVATLAGQEPNLPGCEVLVLPPASGRVSVPALLTELGKRRVTNLLVEGGAEVHGSFRDAAAVDEVHVFLAPKLIGGITARSPLSGQGADRLADALPVAAWEVEQLEPDVYVHGWCRGMPPGSSGNLH